MHSKIHTLLQFLALSLLDIEDGVDWVHSRLVLRSLTDQTLFRSERNEGWSGERALFVGDDLYTSALVVGNA